MVGTRRQSDFQSNDWLQTCITHFLAHLRDLFLDDTDRISITNNHVLYHQSPEISFTVEVCYQNIRWHKLSHAADVPTGLRFSMAINPLCRYTLDDLLIFIPRFGWTKTSYYR